MSRQKSRRNAFGVSREPKGQNEDKKRTGEVRSRGTGPAPEKIGIDMACYGRWICAT